MSAIFLTNPKRGYTTVQYDDGSFGIIEDGVLYKYGKDYIEITEFTRINNT